MENLFCSIIYHVHYLVQGFVGFCSWCMSEQDIVSRQVRFSARVTPRANWGTKRERASLRWQGPRIITPNHENICLVNSCPMMNSVPELSEAHFSICCKILPANPMKPEWLLALQVGKKYQQREVKEKGFYKTDKPAHYFPIYPPTILVL